MCIIDLPFLILLLECLSQIYTCAKGVGILSLLQSYMALTQTNNHTLKQYHTLFNILLLMNFYLKCLSEVLFTIINILLLLLIIII